MLTCKDVSDVASDYMDGPTTLLQRINFRLHLLMCVHCRRYFQQLKLAAGIAGKYELPAEPSDDETDALISKLNKQKT